MGDPRFDLDAPATRADVERRVGAALGTSATVTRWTRLSGGAIQQNLALDLRTDAGPRRVVLRTDARSAVAASRSRLEEFALMSAAARAGVQVPAPICAVPCTAARPAYTVMGHVEGVAAGYRLTRPGAVADPAALLRELGANLALLHALAPLPPSLAFLGPAPTAPTRGLLDGYRDYLDHWRRRFGDAWPALEWGLRWWQERAGDRETAVLVHRDYRTGNYLVDSGRLAAVLDWEFAGWGNPLEDLGWFCAPCWRFAAPDRVAGGIGPAADFLGAYNAVAGTGYTEADTRDWQALAQLRWAIIALQQCERHMGGGETSLELALTGRLLPRLERDLLALTPA